VNFLFGYTLQTGPKTVFNIPAMLNTSVMGKYVTTAQTKVLQRNRIFPVHDTTLWATKLYIK